MSGRTSSVAAQCECVPIRRWRPTGTGRQRTVIRKGRAVGSRYANALIEVPDRDGAESKCEERVRTRQKLVAVAEPVTVRIECSVNRIQRIKAKLDLPLVGGTIAVVVRVVVVPDAISIGIDLFPTIVGEHVERIGNSVGIAVSIERVQPSLKFL